MSIILKPASYGKKSNNWYTTPTSGGSRGGVSGSGTGGTGGWQSRPGAVASLSRKASITEEAPPPGGGKPSSGRVIRIVNNHDHTVQVRKKEKERRSFISLIYLRCFVTYETHFISGQEILNQRIKFI